MCEIQDCHGEDLKTHRERFTRPFAFVTCETHVSGDTGTNSSACSVVEVQDKS
jgi:hypothetical protein